MAGLCWGACSPALASCVLLWSRESVPFAGVCTVLLVSSLYRKLVLLFLIYILLTFDRKKKKIDESDDLQMVYFQEESKANSWRPKIEELPPRSIESIPSSVQPPKPDLKPLQFNLKYSFLGENETFPVIISSKLNAHQEGKLLKL